MIRAVIRGEKIEPLEPLPTDWAEGRELLVDAAPKQGDPDENWLADMDRLTSTLGSDADWDLIDAELAEADAAAKEIVRREMGLD